MKLIYIIVGKDDADNVIHELNLSGHKSTKISSSGGFLHKGNVTLMVGTEEQEVPRVIKIVKQVCGERKTIDIKVPYINGSQCGGVPVYYGGIPQKVEVGGATIFVVNVEYYEQL